MDQEFEAEIDRDLLENGPGEPPFIRLAKAEQRVRELTATTRQLETALAEALTWKDKWEKCETWRKAYQEAKGELYAMGGEIAEAAIQHMPCNEAMVDRWFRAEYIYKAAFDAVTAELAEAREDAARLTYMIDQSNQGNGWLQDHVWDEAARLCPLDTKEAENVQKWGRAAIDAARKP